MRRIGYDALIKLIKVRAFAQNVESVPALNITSIVELG
jgi:hypothetical protein